jgi:glycosyltransferase involved in cell wall biosynthesis
VKFSIVIPAHNEEERLSPVLEAYSRFFTDKLGAEAEIILVANGCSDATATVAEEIAERYGNVRVIDEPRRIGKGGAVIVGVKAAVGDYIGFVDADGATAPEEFYRLYKKSLDSDGVIASRWMEGADVVIPQRAMRLLSSRLFNGLTRVLLGLRYKDTQCGAKIFTRQAWKDVLPNIGITRFAFDVDVLYQLKRKGYAISEEPTVWRDIAGSKVHFFNSSIDMFLAIVRMRLVYSPLRPVVSIYERYFSRSVEFFLRDELFRHTSLLFVASMVTMVGNMGYHMVAGRALPKPEYALLVTFLALYTILMRPLNTLATAMNRYSSLLLEEGRSNCVIRLLIKWSALAGIPSLVAAVVCVLAAEPIASFFHLERTAPVVVSALALPALFLFPVVSGILRGMQRFVWLSCSSISNAAVRVSLGALLIYLVFPACGWALLGHVGGMYVGLLILFLGLIPIKLNRGDDVKPLPSLRFYLLQCFVIQTSLAVLMTGDVIMVKRYLPAEMDFAYAATLGRIVAFMAASVAGAMFPKVASDRVFTARHRALYLRAVLYAGGFIGISLVICLLFTNQFLSFVFRITEPSRDLLILTRWMAVIMAPATLLNINVGLLLAQRRFKILWVVVLLAVLYLGLVHFYHASAYWVVAFAGCTNLAAWLATSFGILRKLKSD